MTRQDLPMFIVYEGEQEGQRWLLDQERMVVGRTSDCDIVLAERQVSRHHAQIERDDDGYLLRDLGSKNGTYINGKQVRDAPCRLKDGDEIQIALCVKLGFVGADVTLPLELTGSPVTPRRGIGPYGTMPRRGIGPYGTMPDTGLRIDRPARKVFIGERELAPLLSPAQYRLLELLLDREGEVVSRDEIVMSVWSEEEALGVSEQAIDALVYRLRDRIAALDPQHDYIVTVRGHGFRLDNHK